VHRVCFHQILICAFALLAGVTLGAQQPAPTSATPPAATSAMPQGPIHDPVELSAYSAAMQTQDPTARAESLEAFVQQYPHTAVMTEALEEEMAAWQTAGDSSRVMRVAKRLLALDPANIRALGIVVALDRVNAAKGDNAALNEMCVDASGGMLAVPMWRRPANMSPADYVRLSKLLNDIFIGAEGYCAVEQKNYSQAMDWLGRALKLDPTNVQDTYQMAVADLESTPLDVQGFWYCARAMNLAQAAAIPQDATSMATYCKGKYTKVHGADDGWDALVASVATEDAPPPDFAKQIDSRLKAAPAAQQK
jgi:tetratricopeptide (TPR) repeat protein